MGRRSKKVFLQRLEMANRYMKRRSTSLIIREKKTIKTTVTYHLTNMKLATIKKAENECWWGARKIGTLVHCWRECKMQQLWKTIRSFLKKIKNRTTIWPGNLTSGYISKRIENRILKTYLHTPIFIAAQ